MRQIVLAVALLTGLTYGAALPPRVVLARADGDMERARALIEEARPWSRRAGNAELDPSVRKEARRQAHDRLVEARGHFDAFLDANPGQVEALDAEYCEMASMLYWIRKMASFSEFDRKTERVAELPVVEEPVDPAPDPEHPDPGPGPDADVGGPAPPTERELLESRATRTLEAVRAEERANPGDVPRLHSLYEKYLAEFDDPTLPGFDAAATRIGELAARMKTVFKEEVGADPDAIDNVDSDEAGKIAKGLGRLLASRDVEERRRAARLLGATNSGAGAYALCKALRDDDAEVVTLAADALVGIGGSRVAYNLVKQYRDRNAEDALVALDVLLRGAKVSDVDARSLASSIGRFVLAKDDEVANAAMDGLAGLGAAGGAGLVEAIATNDIEKKKRLMWAIADIGYVPGTKAIGNYLVQGDGERLETLRQAAIEALKKLGDGAVPDLIDLLQSRKHRLWTAWLLREMTGQRLGANDAREWRRWWEKNHPDEDE